MGDQCVNICKVIPLSGNEPPSTRRWSTDPRDGQADPGADQPGKARPSPGATSNWPRDLVRQDDMVDNLNRECFRLALEIGDDADRREWAMTMLLVGAGDRADRRQRRRHRRAGRLRGYRAVPGVRGRLASSRVGARVLSRGEGGAAGGPRSVLGPPHPAPPTRGSVEIRGVWEDEKESGMLCAAIDIGSNTTRVLVAEPVDGQLKKVMEQRAYTRINKALDAGGAILAEKIDEVGEVVSTQVRLARELGAEEIRAVATAAVREASNGERSR